MGTLGRAVYMCQSKKTKRATQHNNMPFLNPRDSSAKLPFLLQPVAWPTRNGQTCMHAWMPDQAVHQQSQDSCVRVKTRQHAESRATCMSTHQPSREATCMHACLPVGNVQTCMHACGYLALCIWVTTIYRLTNIQILTYTYVYTLKVRTSSIGLWFQFSQ